MDERERLAVGIAYRSRATASTGEGLTAMAVHSAALLLHRSVDGSLEVFLGHMGGPFWARKDDGAWSVPKGEFDPATEDAADAARRSFPEIDRAGWFGLAEARSKVVKGQVPALDALAAGLV